MNDDELLKKQAAADFLGVSKRSIERRIKEGLIKPTRVNGGIRIAKSELVRFLKKRNHEK